MGCCGVARPASTLLNDPLNFKLYKVEPIELDKDNYKNLNNLFQRASSIMETFENLREKIVDNLDILIYKTGASVYITPTIVHCLNNIWYKMSRDMNGEIEKLNILYTEDSPFMSLNQVPLPPDTIKLLNLMFDYINGLRRIKTTIKQLETNLAELIYLLNENNIPAKNNVCTNNKNKIEQATKMFPELHNFYNLVLQKYRYEIYSFVVRREEYEYRINLIGKEAAENNLNDINKIAFLYKKLQKENAFVLREELMYNNEIIGRKKYLDIINNKKRAKKDFNFIRMETKDDWELSLESSQKE